ncbi:MAG: molecular chaperone TorD family protein [Deferribacteraceae bacterium]|jgi:anaerobic sulfite reductase subunit A|nr:molecular chaperone TorD family protein [Deferribacteraceae bacterium]
MEETLRQRALIYNLLSKLYLKEVDGKLLEMLKAFDYTLFDENTEFDRGFRMLGKAVAEITPFTLVNLARDYARSFFGAGLAKNCGAYPYESVYTSKDHLLMQEARDDVVRCYQDEMLGRSKEFAEPEDHIAFELEFMAKLCEKAADATALGDEKSLKDYLAKQKNFFENHLNTWIPTFCDDLEKLAREPFYKAAAIITHGFIKEEQEELSEAFA